MPVKSQILGKQIEMQQVAGKKYRRAKDKKKEVIYDRLALFCSVGGFKRIFNLFPLPEKPSIAHKAQNANDIEYMKPQVVDQPTVVESLVPLDFENAKIFSFFQVQAEESVAGSHKKFYVMIANGEKLNQSIIVLDN